MRMSVWISDVCSSDLAPAVRNHEIDGLGRDELGGHDQVAFVFAVFFVDQDDDTPGAQFGDDLGNRCDTEGFRSGAGRNRGKRGRHGQRRVRENLDFTALQRGWGAPVAQVPNMFLRSEEHTSELQSLMRISYAVFCLKKKHTHEIQSAAIKK